MKKPPHFYKQSGVIPYRITGNGIEVLLITTRKKKKWIIPKGVIERNYTAKHSAVKEAFEEAGIKGIVSDTPVGYYQYEKWEGTCTVELYLLNVTEELAGWPESFRLRIWRAPETAATLIQNQQLSEIINNLPELIIN